MRLPRIPRFVIALLTAVALSACGSTSPAPAPTPVPTTPTPQPAPTPTPTVPTVTTFTVSGTVTDGTSGGVLPNIDLSLTDSAGTGRATRSDASGAYTIASVASGTATLVAFAISYQSVTTQFSVTANTRVDVVLPRVLAPVPTPTPAPSTITGTWVGDAVYSGCLQSGTVASVLNPCGTGFVSGAVHPVAFMLTQTGNAITGQIAFGNVVGNVNGALTANGHFSLSGQTTDVVGGIAFVTTITQMDAAVSGNTMGGIWLDTLTVSGLTGGAAVVDTIRTMTRR